MILDDEDDDDELPKMQQAISLDLFLQFFANQENKYWIMCDQGESRSLKVFD